MAKDIIKLLVQPGSAITLVFWPQRHVPNSKGNPSAGGAKSPIISETVRDRTLVAMGR